MGVAETLRVGSSYAHARLLPRLPENSLEDFLVNRFGERLYRTFFKDYTEKVWGVPCTEISAAWGAQRIKGLSVSKALAHALSAPFRSSTDTAQTRTETSLIERFLYPKLGPGQMWEAVAREVAARGGEVHLRHRVVGIETKRRHRDRRQRCAMRAPASVRRVAVRLFLSTLPVHDLVAMLLPEDERVAQRCP